MRNRLIVTVLLLALLLFAIEEARASRARQTSERCFAETGQCISGEIRTFWERNGGLAVFGLPLEPLQELVDADGARLQAQLFERHRLELHPANPSPYKVLLGRLGVERLEAQGRDWQSFPPLGPNDADAENCAYFAATRQQVCGSFLQAFRSNGLHFTDGLGISLEESLALFGLPISGRMTETIEGKELTVQWFERARFELHPESQPPATLQFGRLGAEQQANHGGPTALLEGGEWRLVWYGTIDRPVAAVAEPPATLSLQGALLFGSSGCNSFRGGYTASESTLAIEPLITTLVLCTDRALAAQEAAILAALQGEVSYAIVGDELRISYDGGRQQLVYSSEN